MLTSDNKMGADHRSAEGPLSGAKPAFSTPARQWKDIGAVPQTSEPMNRPFRHSREGGYLGVAGREIPAFAGMTAVSAASPVNRSPRLTLPSPRSG